MVDDGGRVRPIPHGTHPRKYQQTTEIWDVQDVGDVGDEPAVVARADAVAEEGAVVVHHGAAPGGVGGGVVLRFESGSIAHPTRSSTRIHTHATRSHHHQRTCGKPGSASTAGGARPCRRGTAAAPASAAGAV